MKTTLRQRIERGTPLILGTFTADRGEGARFRVGPVAAGALYLGHKPCRRPIGVAFSIGRRGAFVGVLTRNALRLAAQEASR